MNLVSNAIRYSPSGGRIRLSWQWHPHGARFEISDQGIGMAKEHISRITERFYRIDLAGSRAKGGTGLGLAIVKHVCDDTGHDSKWTASPESAAALLSRYPFTLTLNAISMTKPICMLLTA